MLLTIHLILTHIQKWHICDIYYTSLCDKVELSVISIKGDTNGVKRRIRQRGTTTITTETILLSSTPTVTHNSKHYSVQTTGRCNTPRFIISLVIELPRQSVATNTDFSSMLLMPCFAADIALVVQTNWYYHVVQTNWYYQLHIRQLTFSTVWYHRIWNPSM